MERVNNRNQSGDIKAVKIKYKQCNYVLGREQYQQKWCLKIRIFPLTLELIPEVYNVARHVAPKLNISLLPLDLFPRNKLLLSVSAKIYEKM